MEESQCNGSHFNENVEQYMGMQEDTNDGDQNVELNADQNDSTEGYSVDAANACGGTSAARQSTRTDDAELKFFVGGIHPEAWDEDVKSYFSQFGEVKEVRVMKDHATGRNRGFGFVTLGGANINKEGLFSGEHKLKGKRVEVREMQPEGTSNLKRKVFVGGISPSLNEADLSEYFGKFGDIEKVTIMRDLEAKSRGFGFVVFTDESAVTSVLEKKSHQLSNDNKVDVRAAEARYRSKTNVNNYGTGYNTAGMQAPMYANYYNQMYGRASPVAAQYGMQYGMYAGMPSARVMGSYASPTGQYVPMGYGMSQGYGSYGPLRTTAATQPRSRGPNRTGPY